MWRLKLKLTTKGHILANLAKKHNVLLTGYPLSYYKDKKYLNLISAGIMFGTEKNKKALTKEIKASKEITKMEISGDFAIGITRQPLFTEYIYDPKIIRPFPVLLNKDGYVIWDLASFDRKVLEKVLKLTQKYFEAKVLKFKQEKLSTISLTRLLPDISKQQKKALELAVSKGYYDYPKKIKMEDLAKIMAISYSTYQAHLKKAEGKIIPEIYKNL